MSRYCGIDSLWIDEFLDQLTEEKRRSARQDERFGGDFNSLKVEEGKNEQEQREDAYKKSRRN